MTDNGITAGEAARRLGIAVTTLRSWDRRYGLGPTGHHPPRHRRYTAEDMNRLETVRRLTSTGMPVAQAAEIALRPRSRALPPAGALASAASRMRGLKRAVLRLDAVTTAGLLRSELDSHGVEATWDHIIRPVLVWLGDRHVATNHLIETEHLFSRTVSDVLAALRRPTSDMPVRTLLACATDEEHTLPLEALAAALATAGIGSRLLGARVPPAALVTAVARTGPTAVAVWSQMPATADPQGLAAVTAARPRPVLILAGGRGWADIALPEGVDRPASIADAVDSIRALAG